VGGKDVGMLSPLSRTDEYYIELSDADRRRCGTF
jgi:hypothetical protein